MNDLRRKKINEIKEKMEGIHLELETLEDEEQDYYDNMPTGFQDGQKGEKAMEAIDELMEAKDKAQEIIEALEKAVEK